MSAHRKTNRACRTVGRHEEYKAEQGAKRRAETAAFRNNERRGDPRPRRDDRGGADAGGRDDRNGRR